MLCEQLTAQLDDFLDEQLDASRQQILQAHIETCAACDRLVRDANALQRALQAYPVEDPTPGFADRALAAAVQQNEVRRERPRRLVAIGFVAAIAASLLTLTFTNLLVQAPNPVTDTTLPTVHMTVDQRRTVNLVFASNSAVDNVILVLDLPSGIELSGYPGRDQVRWNTSLTAGNNVLPLELIASDVIEGQLIARMQHADKETIFRVNIAVGS